MTTDWISIPLVAFPLVSSVVILAFVAYASPAARRRIGPTVRMTTLIFSLLMLALTTGMFFGFNDVAGVSDWAILDFDKFNYEARYVCCLLYTSPSPRDQ